LDQTPRDKRGEGNSKGGLSRRHIGDIVEIVLTLPYVLPQLGRLPRGYIGYEYRCVQGHRYIAGGQYGPVKLNPSGYVRVREFAQTAVLA
jgi:hypothetical protein